MPTEVTDDRALIDPGLGGFIAGYDASGALIKGHPEFVTYSFETDGSSAQGGSYNQTFRDSFQPLSSTEQDEARNAFSQWGAASGLTFFEVPAGEGDIKLARFNFDAGGPNPSSIAAGYGGYGIVYVSDKFTDAGVHLFLHEIGHNLGLKHPFQGDFVLSSADDNFSHSVMSYTSGGVAGDVLGSLDTVAIADLYGPASSDGTQVQSWSWDAATYTLTQTGFSTDDVLKGVGGHNLVHGGDGDDLISGKPSAVGQFYGDAGNDTLSGGQANVLLDGGVGDDTLNLNLFYLDPAQPSAVATLAGGEGGDTISINADSDGFSRLSGLNVGGGGGSDTISLYIGSGEAAAAGPKPTQLSGDDGNDRISVFVAPTALGALSGLSITGGNGVDNIYLSMNDGAFDGAVAPRASIDGGAGDDLVTVASSVAAAAILHLSGGAGSDMLTFMSNPLGSNVILPDLLSAGCSIDGFERLALQGYNGVDVMVALDLPTQLSGGSGDDVLTGGAANDTLFGGDAADHDWLQGGAGDDYIASNANSVTGLAETSAQVRIQNYGASVVVLGPDGQDTISGGGYLRFDDGLYVANGQSLQAVGGASITGSATDDTLTGTPADDTLVGGNGYDVAILGEPFGTAVVSYAPDGTLLVSGSYGADTLISVERIVFRNGPSEDDSYDVGADGRLITVAGLRLSAPDGVTKLLGAGGDDTLTGGPGNDTLTGGARSDALNGGGGVDAAIYSSFAQNYMLALSGGAGTIAGGPEGGEDTLSSVENVRFLDGVLTFDPQSTAAQIVRLYDSFLGRAPDAFGFESYLRFVAAGHSFQDMADSAATSAEFHDATASLNDTDYVTYVYHHSLHREPDPGGLQTYVQDLQNGTFTRTSLIVQAAESPEHVALTAGVVAAGLWIPNEQVESLELLYDAAVRRPPDEVGLKGYGDLIASGTSYRQIANDMSNSAEFLTAHAGQDDAAFVDSLYVAEVGRHADPGGLAAYTDQLAHGYTRGDVLWETAFSLEHQGRVLAFVDPLLG